jgi:DNA polymerase III delta subunit
MKKTLTILAALALMSFATERFITLKFSEPQLNYHWKNLENVKKLVDESNLPHAQVKFIINSIDSLQKDIKKTAKLDSAATVIAPKK